MGNVSASNIIDNNVSTMVDVSNSTSQKCVPTTTQEQLLRVVGNCPHSNINISHINFASAATISTSCAQKAVQSAEAKTQVEQVASQMAEAVSQAMTLNPGSTDSKNIMNLSMNVAVAVNNTVAQMVAPAASQSQIVDLTGCEVNVSFVDYNAYAKNFAEAVQSSNQVSNAVTALKQAAKQIAKSKQEGMFAWIVAIVVGIVAIVVAFLGLGGGKALKKFMNPLKRGGGTGVFHNRLHAPISA